jgi:hypothetical protein
MFSSQRQVGLKNAVKQRAVDLLRKQINFGKDQKLAANDWPPLAYVIIKEQHCMLNIKKY